MHGVKPPRARMRDLRRRVGLWAAALCLAGCSTSPPPNVLVIVIDTLRADRVGWYGNHRDLTPFLDSLAGHASVFWNAYAQSSWTSASVASLLTSRYPSQHGVTRWDAVLPAAEQTLPQLFKPRGYATAAFLANRILDAKFGYAHGFDVYAVFPKDDPNSAGKPLDPFARALVKERGERLNRECLAWLETVAATGPTTPPVFLYLQYMEPHIPYTPPQDMVDRIMSRHGDAAHEHDTYARMLFVEPQRWNQPDPEALQVIEDLYDAEVASIDARLRELFAALESRGFLRNAVVVVAADHGEEFLDHGRLGHGTSLYNELIHVPLLIAAPAQVQHADVHEVVSLIDVAPTVLHLAGLAPPSTFEGQDLAPFLPAAHALGALLAGMHRVGDAANATAYSQLLEPPGGPFQAARHHEAIVVGARKLLTNARGSEGYDLATDPSEKSPGGLSVAEQQALLAALKASGERAQRATRRERLDNLDDATKEHLRALGYGG